MIVDSLVKSLMYGFGDDRNPANDTVNVMEEILIEYISDVVSYITLAHLPPGSLCAVPTSWGFYPEVAFIH